jgi:hypothetical protein
MILLVATEKQKKELDGFKNGNSILSFVLDEQREWVVSSTVLSDKDFIPILDKLGELKHKELPTYNI